MTAASFTDFESFVNFGLEVFVNPAIFILITLSVLYFLYGVSKYIRSDLSDSDKAEAKQMMIWGVVGLFAIVAMWGLVKIVQGTFKLDNTDTIKLPDTTLTTPSGAR